MPVVLLAAATLPAGFLVADLTGYRPLGGLVLVAIAATTVVVAGAPARRAVGWLAVVGAGFAVAHGLAGALGAWGAVGVTAAASAAAAALLLVRWSSAPSGRGSRGPRAGTGRP